MKKSWGWGTSGAWAVYLLSVSNMWNCTASNFQNVGCGWSHAFQNLCQTRLLKGSRAQVLQPEIKHIFCYPILGSQGAPVMAAMPVCFFGSRSLDQPFLLVLALVAIIKSGLTTNCAPFSRQDYPELASLLVSMSEGSAATTVCSMCHLYVLSEHQSQSLLGLCTLCNSLACTLTNSFLMGSELK